MNLIPKIKRCVCCNSINFLKINGMTYENKFKSLASWVLKKKFNCRKCNTELGLFVNNVNNNEKLVWIELKKCEDPHHDLLNKLQLNKLKYKDQNKKYFETLRKISDIQNQIRLDQSKIKIKSKIQNKGKFPAIRQSY